MPKKAKSSGSKTAKKRYGSKKAKPKAKSAKPKAKVSKSSRPKSKSSRPKSKSSGSKSSRSHLKCPSGKIERSGYGRKAHERRAYNKHDRSGKKVHIMSTYVKHSKVGPACVPAKGKALIRGAKTPESEKILPKLDSKLSLRRFGYGVHKSSSVRHAALRAAVETYGDLKTLRHLSLERNYQADPIAKAIMADDVEYISLLHAKHLMKEGRKPRSKYMKKGGAKKKKSQDGGAKKKKKSQDGGAKKKKRSGSKTAKKKSTKKSTKKASKKASKGKAKKGKTGKKAKKSKKMSGW